MDASTKPFKETGSTATLSSAAHSVTKADDQSTSSTVARP